MMPVPGRERPAYTAEYRPPISIIEDPHYQSHRTDANASFLWDWLMRIFNDGHWRTIFRGIRWSFTARFGRHKPDLLFAYTPVFVGYLEL